MMSLETIQRDNRIMEICISRHLPPHGATICLADGGDGPVLVDLIPLGSDGVGIFSNCPEWVTKAKVYDYYREREQTFDEYFKSLDRDNKAHQFDLLQNRLLPFWTPETGEVQMLTATEVSKLLGCSYSEARERMLDGRIRAIKDGRWMRSKREWVDEYVLKQTIASPVPVPEVGDIKIPKPKRNEGVTIKPGGLALRFLQERAK